MLVYKWNVKGKVMNSVQATRLLNVAVALRDCAEEPKYAKYFSMATYGHACGSPACAMGQYVFRGDLQHTFGLDRKGTPFVLLNVVQRLVKQHRSTEFTTVAKDHFGISYGEYAELFDSTGCGDAKKPLEAAKYIENFVAERVAKVA